MPPVLDPENSKVDGLAFLGLSLARNHYHAIKKDEDDKEQMLGHPDSYTHQTAFDLNEVIDRDYEFLQSTDDNGWLVGGGEAGPPTSYKLAALDSAHVEIMRVGTYRKDWGGLDLKELLEVMASGSIKIPQIEVVPTDVEANPDTPPELEIRFDMECSETQLRSLADGDFETFCDEPTLPINWQLRFLHNQFFRTFVFPSRFCPGAFHSTILRKADFRSDAHRTLYFVKCASAIQKWRHEGPQPLNTIPRHLDGRPLTEEEVVAEVEAAVKNVASLVVESSQGADDLVAVQDEKQEEDDDNDNAVEDYVPPSAEETEAMARLVKKLEDMAPLSPVETTARATSNLEISLDEGICMEENEENNSKSNENHEPETKKEEEETTETKIEEYLEEIATVTKSVHEDEGNIGMAESSLEGKESTLYRHTWDDLVRAGDAETKEEEAPNDISNETETATATEEESPQEVTTSEQVAEETTLEAPPTAETAIEAPSEIAATPAASSVSNNYHSGIWLFTDRENITHFFRPNFLPPYDTPEKKRIIFEVLREEWHEPTLSWKPCGQGSMTKNKRETPGLLGELQKAETMVSGVLKTMIDSVCSPQASPRKQSSAAHF
mmetsp:Transcript_757/g.1731  ORF Transcript_757/g.1731 Transcript_757/m.1731 type:complete len:609 (+) Transcript_757:138-1964(+)|eukprot:CAMPEP_0168195558 /NCGR_PEP_ID=MMETSP0139_2-20121125/19919_1 /TAXON_ID=44445 /ORGANISM="Pseudo-nitzschia australis, Strain 10249 10 AB" /LENGTH=608 /DNA_ID=CAMNT_0008119419 /DNA_START=111 /DNA_END=1937 /DNA_ORIENTATION=+